MVVLVLLDAGIVHQDIYCVEDRMYLIYQLL